MKRLLLLGALMFVLASCTRDPKGEISDDTGDDNMVAADIFTYLTADQSRITYRTAEETYKATRAAATRVIEDAKHPYVTCESVSELKARGVKEYDSSQVGNGGEWLITDATSASELWLNASNNVKFYVAKSNMKIWLTENNNGINGEVYVLDKDANGNPVKGVTFPGYYPQGATSIPNGWYVRLWSASVEFGPLAFNRNAAFYYYGEEELIIPSISESKPNNEKESIWFECHGPIRVTDDLTILQGDWWFGSDINIEKKLTIDEQSDTADITIDFKDCGSINDLYFCASTAKCNINVDYFLNLPNGFDSQKGANFNINLNNAVLVLGGESPVGRVPAGSEIGSGNTDNGRNVFAENKYVYGYGTSAVFIQGSIYAYKDRVNNRVCDFFKTGNKEEDKLGVFGRRYNNGTEEITEEPVINVWISDLGHGEFVDQGYDTPFVDGGVLIKASDTEEYVIGYNEEEGNCRAGFTNGAEPDDPTVRVTPPKHKYSATGIDVMDVTVNGQKETYIYVSWHSNRAQDVDENETDHNHGTNVGQDGSEPSLDDHDDWGGFVDIIKLSTYNPIPVLGGLPGELYITQTAEQHEHKYNHVKLYNNTLYLATTSWQVGAALHVVPLTEDHTGFVSDEIYRVNLTGASANCVEIVGDNIVTISGRSTGGLNWFPLSDYSNQQNKNINETVKNYGGKYIWIYDNHVYALHNTETATVTQYDMNGNQTYELVTEAKLVPYDGKNALRVHDGKVYICCGRNGLKVYDLVSGTKVGETKLSANCVDIDAAGKYFYVATGAGLAKYEVGNVDNNGYYTRLKYVAYFGPGFDYPGIEGMMPDNKQKESSNFVKVHGDLVFVAYGMYGLRIYDANDLTSPDSKPMD